MGVGVVSARLRIPLLVTGFALIVLSWFVSDWLALAGLPMLVLGLACYFVIGTVRAEPTTVALPVTGRWFAVNSPANKVPSHGLHGWGQTYALDLVHDPVERPRPKFASGPGFRRADTFPGFGQPVLAPADGVVVRVHGRERDHRARTSWPAIAYLLVEGMVREALGPGRMLGNHIVLDLGEGVYAALAHLRKGSARVSVGDRVRAGDRLAECGNSGNSSEPHVHMQLMDHRSVVVAAGLPVRFADYEIDGEHHSGVPRNEKPFVAHA